MLYYNVTSRSSLPVRMPSLPVHARSQTARLSRRSVRPSWVRPSWVRPSWAYWPHKAVRPSIMIAAGCGIAMLIAGGVEAASGPVRAVGIENQYADVIAQIGGKDVDVSAIETDPNTDPHSFEVS